MPLRRYFSLVLLFSCVLCSVIVFRSRASAAGHGQEAVVSRVSIAKGDPLELEVKTSSPVSPQSQVISNPERLVIDVPMAVPSAALHNLPVNRGEVKQVRVRLFSSAPSVTRIVVDLKQPQWYQVTPNGSGFRIRVGSPPESPAAEAAPALRTVGWVLSQPRALGRGNGRSVPIVKNPTRPAESPMVNGARVQFSNGLLSIHSVHATLSEVLFQIQRQTGAEISIPAGTEQEQVAADFGPGPPSEVLRQLLDGSGLNFVVVGSATDPNRLSSVILSPKTEPEGSPASSTPSYTPPVEGSTAAPDDASPVPDNSPAAADIPPPGPDNALPGPDNPPAMIDDVPQPQAPGALPQVPPPQD